MLLINNTIISGFKLLSYYPDIPPYAKCDKTITLYFLSFISIILIYNLQY